MRVLLAVLLLSGCLGAAPPAADAPERPSAFPEVATRPVFTITGNLTADAPFDAEGGAVVPKREAYSFDPGNATLYWLPAVHRPSPATTLFVHLTGTTTYADGNVSRFDDVRSFQSANFVANYLVGDQAVATRFTPLPVCDGCPPRVQVDGVTLAPGEGLDRPVYVDVDGTTYTGTLRFENHGLWTVRRIDGCVRFEGCAALPRAGPA